MRTYDFVAVLRPSLTADKRKKTLDAVISWLKDVKVSSQEEMGQKQLSYPIKKETTGFYIKFSLETEGSIPTDFEKKLFAQDDVLRHLVVRTK